MFYYKASFLKQTVFLEKTVKNPFAGGHDTLLNMNVALRKNFNYRFNSIFIEKENEKIDFYR